MEEWDKKSGMKEDLKTNIENGLYLLGTYQFNKSHLFLITAHGTSILEM
jgi:hypothetical protein